MSLARILRALTTLLVIIGIIALLMFFPKFLAATEMALRELRYVWWIVVLAAVAIYLVLGPGKRRR